MSSRSQRFSAIANDWPVEQSKRLSLLDLLSYERCRRTQLSYKAASGFLERFRASSLLKRRPDHRRALIDVLERHVSGAKQHGTSQ